jgi:hypothetical protein
MVDLDADIGGEGNSRATCGHPEPEGLKCRSPHWPLGRWGDLIVAVIVEGSRLPAAAYCTAFIMSKIGRYIATTMPPTITPRTTIITGSISESRAETATSTSSS